MILLVLSIDCYSKQGYCKQYIKFEWAAFKIAEGYLQVYTITANELEALIPIDFSKRS